MNTSRGGLLVLGLVCAGALLGACSSMAIPTVVLRRMNDVGVTYVTDSQSAEKAVRAAIAELGCDFRYVDRFNTESAIGSGSMTIHGRCEKSSQGFVVDINRVFRHEDWRTIRIGVGDFGNNDLAVKFHRILMRSLKYVPERVPASSRDKLLEGGSVASEGLTSYEGVIIVGEDYTIAAPVDGVIIEEAK